MRARRPEEGGAVAVFLAVTVVLIVGVGALAVDLGMQRVVRRDMQALADVVALDLSRELDGRTTSQLAVELDLAAPASALSVALAGNADTLGSDPLVTVTWGAWRGGSFVPDIDPPTAVRVIASADTDFAFSNGRGATSRTAYGMSATTACHRLGSFEAVLESEQSAVLDGLNDLLGLNLTLAAYNGLASTPVTLADIAADSSIGTPEQLLTGFVSVSDVMRATVSALQRTKPSGYAATVTTLNSLTTVAGGLGSVQLSRALSIAPSDAAALETRLSVLDVVSAALLAADGTHALSIPNLQAGVAGVGHHFAGSLDVINAAALACGRPNSLEARATSRQLRGDIGVEFVNLPSLNLNAGLVKGTVQTTKGTGSIHVSLGNATSQLVDPPAVHCGAQTQADPSRFTVGLSPGLAEYWLDAIVEVIGTVRIAGVRAEVDMEVRLRSSGPGTSTTALLVPLTISGQDHVPFRTGQPVGLLSSVVPTVVASSVTVAGLPVGLRDLALVQDSIISALTTGSNNFVDKTLRPLAANIDRDLVGPAARLLGIRVGGADVFAVSAICNAPSLRG